MCQNIANPTQQLEIQQTSISRMRRLFFFLFIVFSSTFSSFSSIDKIIDNKNIKFYEKKFPFLFSNKFLNSSFISSSLNNFQTFKDNFSNLKVKVS